MGRKSRTRNTNEPRVVGARGEAQNHTHPQPSLGAPTAEANTNNAPTPNAEVTSTPTPRESLTKNKFCKGIKHGRRYVCGGEADESAIDKAVDLLIEAVRRIQHWRVWETWWIEEAMDEWLMKRDKLEAQLRGKYGDDVVNDLLRLVDKFISYTEDFWRYWRNIGDEVRGIIEDIVNGRTEVIIRGNNAPGISIHGKYITLNTDKTKTGTTIHLLLKGLKGISIEAPDIFIKTMKKEYDEFIEGILLALRAGLEETDGYVDYGKAAMNTNQIWQALLWSLLNYGYVHLHINAVSVNKEDVALTWQQRTDYNVMKDYIDISIMENEAMLLGFILGMILGDGTVYIDRHNNQPMIRIPMIARRYRVLKSLLNKLYELGFYWRRYPRYESDIKENTLVRIEFLSGNAVNIAKAIISAMPPLLQDIFDALNIEKWMRLKQIAGMKLKYRVGESQIDVAHISFSVNVMRSTIELKHYVKDASEIEKITKMLKTKYGDEFANNIRVNNGGNGRQVIVIPARLIEMYDDIKAQVIQVLCKKLEKSEDEEKRQILIKHLTRLAPTKGTAAADHWQNLKNTKHAPK